MSIGRRLPPWLSIVNVGPTWAAFPSSSDGSPAVNHVSFLCSIPSKDEGAAHAIPGLMGLSLHLDEVLGSKSVTFSRSQVTHFRMLN